MTKLGRENAHEQNNLVISQGRSIGGGRDESAPTRLRRDACSPLINLLLPIIGPYDGFATLNMYSDYVVHVHFRAPVPSLHSQDCTDLILTFDRLVNVTITVTNASQNFLEV